MMKISEPKWKPTKGGIYRVANKNGHPINSLSKGVYGLNEQHSKRKISYIDNNELFMFLGKQESIPEHFSFYQILYKEKVLWLICPWRLYDECDKIVFPIREI